MLSSTKYFQLSICSGWTFNEYPAIANTFSLVAILMRQRLLILIIVTSCFSCSLSNDSIKQAWWKYGSGYHMGDVLQFNDTNFRNDSIFDGSRAVALIIKKKKAIYGRDNSITIKSIGTNQTGIYYQK